MKKQKTPKQDIKSYLHVGENRSNNPPVGLVTPATDPSAAHRLYEHDPHIDPQLTWAGKFETPNLNIPTVSLHTHERIDPCTIIDAVRKRNGDQVQLSLFENPEQNPPIRKAIEFYKHQHSWTNRLIAGDSLLVMNSLLEKEGLGEQLQTIYIDPPYGIRYGSNFQPFIKADKKITDGKDEDLTAEPEQIKAFRDTWEMGIHSYLTYLRDRLLLARELLKESGSCFMQIGDENVHLAHQLMSEIFGPENFISQISFRTKMTMTSAHLPNIADYIIWFAKDKKKVKFRKLFVPRKSGEGTLFSKQADANDASEKGKYFRLDDLMASGYGQSTHFEFELNGRVAKPSSTKSWKTTKQGIERLKLADRIQWSNKTPRYVFYFDDYPVQEITNQWHDTQGAVGKTYAVQTATKVIERCILMTSNPGDLVFDPTCGSGTTAFVAEKWGRRWISCDTSRVAIALARQRLMTATFDYYKLAKPNDGVGRGFQCKEIPHITLGSIANNEQIKPGMTPAAIDEVIMRYASKEVLHDQPEKDKSKIRVTGPFTVEAVPAPVVYPVNKTTDIEPADMSVSRMGQTIRQTDWRDELLKTGIRGKHGQLLSFVRLEPLPGMYYLHADGEIKSTSDHGNTSGEESNHSERVVVSFGPDHAPLEQRQVSAALEEAQSLVPKPRIVVFASFQFDPEASKDIDETNWPEVTLLKAQMNADLLTTDLKKKRASNESFWLIGQPEVSAKKIAEGTDKGKFRVSVEGFDYYDVQKGKIISGDTKRIAMWMLDTDYDGRSLFPRQVFFPMPPGKDDLLKLAKNLKAGVDDDLINKYIGTESLPFDLGEHSRAAIKIVDDRGIESLKVVVLR